ncbi:hypothetical protein E2I00_014919 [Balaenoptera physalus]|uniref:Arf-GAP domain-containing protein n=1 Tax=Balaenoptera physalus TaxID=9770 RepID=A0A643CDD4_BALPH|nr:hypothetical protein E2I00_014919 [Balaenoptera physalus]
MTTFTEPEVVFLQSRGNEVCRKIWLGLFDARTSLIPDSRDPQKVKEFLQEKYEKKRWYVPPDQVKGPTYTKGGASTPVQGSIPEGKPPRTLLGDPVPSLSAAASTSSQSVSQSQPRTSQPRSSQPPPPSSVKKASTDLLADIGGDPFAAPQVAPAFAAFPAFGGKWDLGREPSYNEGSRSAVRTDVWGRPVTDTLSLLPTYLPFPCPTLTASQSDATWKSQLRTPLVPSLPSPSTAPLPPSLLLPFPSCLMPAPPVLHPVPAQGAARGLHLLPLLWHLPVSPTALQIWAASWDPGHQLEASLAAAFNPFTTPAAHAQLPSTNPFQPNGLATGSSFGDQGSAKLGQRPLSQPAGISTNPFMTGSSSSPFACNPPNTNPFL